jgi:hypothetical protein
VGWSSRSTLERGPAQGAVLLAPVPRGGTIGATARLTARHPVVMLQATLSLRLRPFVATPALIRELFFTPDTPQALVDDTKRLICARGLVVGPRGCRQAAIHHPCRGRAPPANRPMEPPRPANLGRDVDGCGGAGAGRRRGEALKPLAMQPGTAEDGLDRDFVGDQRQVD